MDALIGYSGFVGSTLLKQRRFDALFRSTNIGEIEGSAFDTVVCAAAPAQKWLANKEPVEDWKKLQRLIDHIDTIRCRQFILISTVDVFANPVGVTEDSPATETDLCPYGYHRLRLEQAVENRFPETMIVRLPGLVGPGLRKNLVFDFHNANNLDSIDSRGVFQFYPMVNLWPDIVVAKAAKIKLIHLTAEPVSVEYLVRNCFSIEWQKITSKPVSKYDMRTKHSSIYGRTGDYQYDRRETIMAIRSYVQSESRVLVESMGL